MFAPPEHRGRHRMSVVVAEPSECVVERVAALAMRAQTACRASEQVSLRIRPMGQWASVEANKVGAVGAANSSDSAVRKRTTITIERGSIRVEVRPNGTGQQRESNQQPHGWEINAESSLGSWLSIFE